jgi:hypothetical protein
MNEPMIRIFVDADACPVKEEVYRIAERHALRVYVVATVRFRCPAMAWSNGSRWRPASMPPTTGSPNADPAVIVVTNDTPLANNRAKESHRAQGSKRGNVTQLVYLLFSRRNVVEGFYGCGQPRFRIAPTELLDTRREHVRQTKTSSAI